MTFRATAPLLCLIGYRGTGKTTVAGHLGSLLGWPVIDADVELERRAGRTIREIFATDGEPAFRDLESRLVAELTHRDRLVLALGGGAILREANRAAIRRGFVVWLQADPGTIWERLNTDPTTRERRPNLTTGGREEVEQLLAAREPLYRECADLAVDAGRLSPDRIAEQIVCLVRQNTTLLNEASA